MKPGFFKPQETHLAKTDRHCLYTGIAFYGIAAVGLIAYLPVKTIMIGAAVLLGGALAFNELISNLDPGKFGEPFVRIPGVYPERRAPLKP